jgi:hypothetical protein
MAADDTTDTPDPTQNPEDQPAVPGYADATTFSTGFRIPAGGTLIRVRNATGTDAPWTFFIAYTVYGVTMTYEVGDTAELTRLFGGTDEFDSVRTFYDAGRFNRQDWLSMGMIGEQLGATEGIQAQIQRGVQQMGYEDLPRWMRTSTEVMTILFNGVREGWSEGRILRDLSGTAAFTQRFSGLNALQGMMGGASLAEVMDTYLARETAIREMLVTYRGANTNLTNQYLGQIISSGWAPTEVQEMLRAEQLLQGDSGQLALTDLNRILRASGMDTVGPRQFLELMRGNAAPQVFEAINDTLRAQALREQGLEISPELAASLGEGVAFSVASASQLGQFSTAAQNAAYAIISNKLELEAGKFGISRDEIIQAAFGEGYSQEVEIKLQKFARERQNAAEGYGAATGYQSNKGRLVIAGLEGL